VKKYYVVNAHVIENCLQDIKEDKKYFMTPPYAEKFGIVLQRKNNKHV
jgi:hypothetical protein